MKLSFGSKAEVLIQALPYIQKYNQKVVVIKYGGNAMVNEKLKQAVMSDVVLLSLIGLHVVIVHGGGPDITDVLKKMGKESRFVDGLRYTDQETVEVVQMVLAGKVNKDLVSLLGQQGGKALGLCGLDGGMIETKKMQTGEDLGFVGEIVKMNPEPIIDALKAGYIPVISTIGSDDKGQVYNINADTVAAKIASELQAENLIVMTDVRGIMRDQHDDETMMPEVKITEVKQLIDEGVISGGMIPKIECCVETIRRGVKKAIIIDGRIEHAILIELLSDEGVGTLLHA